MEITQDMVGWDMKLVEIGPDGSNYGIGAIGGDLEVTDRSYSEKLITVNTVDYVFEKLQSENASLKANYVNALAVEKLRSDRYREALGNVKHYVLDLECYCVELTCDRCKIIEIIDKSLREE